MLGRPLGNGGGVITGGLMGIGATHMQPPPAEERVVGTGRSDDVMSSGLPLGGSAKGGGYLPPLHAQPRLFSDPSCLPRGAGPDPSLLRRLQGIRDGYELRSACILPCMALVLTLLTLTCQLSVRGRESAYLPLAFLPTFFVYSVERHLLRPRAAKQIHDVQREMRETVSYTHLRAHET